MVMDPIVVRVRTKTRTNSFREHSLIDCVLLFRPKDKTFRWKFDDGTVRLAADNGIHPVCRLVCVCVFFYT